MPTEEGHRIVQYQERLATAEKEIIAYSKRVHKLVLGLQDAAEVIHAIGLHTEYGHGPDYSACDMSICEKNIRILEDTTF